MQTEKSQPEGKRIMPETRFMSCAMLHTSAKESIICLFHSVMLLPSSLHPPPPPPMKDFAFFSYNGYTARKREKKLLYFHDCPTFNRDRLFQRKKCYKGTNSFLRNKHLNLEVRNCPGKYEKATMEITPLCKNGGKTWRCTYVFEKGNRQNK